MLPVQLSPCHHCHSCLAVIIASYVIKNAAINAPVIMPSPLCHHCLHDHCSLNFALSLPYQCHCDTPYHCHHCRCHSCRAIVATVAMLLIAIVIKLPCHCCHCCSAAMSSLLQFHAVIPTVAVLPPLSHCNICTTVSSSQSICHLIIVIIAAPHCSCHLIIAIVNAPSLHHCHHCHHS